MKANCEIPEWCKFPEHKISGCWACEGCLLYCNYYKFFKQIKEKTRNRIIDFLHKCFIAFILFILFVAFFVSQIETTDRRVMYKLLNYSRETIVEKEAKYFKLPDLPEFKIYPINKNELRVVFTDGKTVTE